MPDKDDGASVASLLHRAFPLRPDDTVTHLDLAHLETSFEQKLQALDRVMSLRIKNSEVTQRNWILTGCIAIMLVFGGGYISIVSKLDRLSEMLPSLQHTMETRRLWMQRQEQRDNIQDHQLKEMDNTYAAMPYVEPPS